MSDAEMVPVLPCDREAANAFFRRADCPVSVKMTLGYDPTPLAQILAAHRLAAEAAAIEKAIKAVEDVPDRIPLPDRVIPAHDDEDDFGNPTGFRIAEQRLKRHRLPNRKDFATAIRSLKEGASHVG